MIGDPHIKGIPRLPDGIGDNFSPVVWQDMHLSGRRASRLVSPVAWYDQEWPADTRVGVEVGWPASS